MDGLKKLKRLNLFNNPDLGVKDYKTINKMINLEELYLFHAISKNDLLAELKDLTKIKSLILTSCKNLTQNDMNTLFKLESLEDLDMHRTEIPLGSIIGINKLKNLKKLFLAYMELDVEEIDSISQMKKVECLSLFGCKIPKDMICDFRSLRTLKTFTFCILDPLGQEDLQYLKEMDRLGKLEGDILKVLEMQTDNI